MLWVRYHKEVLPMTHKPFIQESRWTLVCVDSYEDGVMKGRFFDPCQQSESFDSLAQFLIRMEQLLNHRQEPQAYTQARTFSSLLMPQEPGASPASIRRGLLATFELQILFRQHTSWQGRLLWRETGTEQSFRSVLELVILLDSALRSPDGRDAA